MRKVLKNSTVSKFVTKNWIKVNGWSSSQYSHNKNTKFMLYQIYVIFENENDKAQENVSFKNSTPFRSCISKINSTLIDNADDLDIAMLRQNLLEYTQHYSMTLVSMELL